MLPNDSASWLSTVLPARYAEESDEPGPRVPLTRDALPADDAAALWVCHRKLVDEGASPQAAATYLVGWFAGGAAEVVGLMLARTGAGLLLDAGHLTYRLNDPAGRPEAVEIDDPRVLVPSGHSWTGTPGAAVVEGRDAVRHGAVRGLVAFSEPIVDACRRLARVSRTGLWDEVADGLALVFHHETDVTQEMLDELLAATATPGTPWRARPRLGWAHSDLLGRVHIGQKGGCCLYFTCRRQHSDTDDRSGWDAAEVAYTSGSPAARALFRRSDD